MFSIRISMLRILPALVWVSVVVGNAAVGFPEQGRRPNIVWIVGENFALDFGCYGMQHVHTPHVDGLAERGTRFTNVFSTSPVCAPSRSAFMTGMYATTTDMHNMRSHRDDDYRLPPGVEPITHRLRRAGYRTGNIVQIGDKTVGTGKLDLNFVNEGPVFDTNDWEELTGHAPFFAVINLPEAEYDIYDRRSKEKERVLWVGEDWHPKIAKPKEVTPPPYYPDHPIVRQEWARYLDSVSGADVRVGWILDALDRQGLTDDTIVFFFADNGRLEARGIHWCFDSGIHVPLVIAWPDHYPPPDAYSPGSVSDRVISLLDVTATTLEMAGITPPMGMQSRSILVPDAEPQRRFAFSARDRIDETVVTQRSVHDGRFHYIRTFTPGAGFLTLNRYKEKCFLVKPLMRRLHARGQLTGPPAELMNPFPEEMLFDTQADPHEIHNLSDSRLAEHRQVLTAMRAALATWMVETGDRGFRYEPPELVEQFEKEMDQWFGTPQ